MSFRLSAPGSIARDRLRFGRPAAAAALLSVTLLALCGCGPKRIRADFVGFESAYAATSNRETLLNLARLANHDPTYFFKIGQISSSYNMQASLTGQTSYQLQSSNVGLGAVAGQGTPGLSISNNPSFTFIPVNDQINAQLLLQPIPAETFYALYQEGWRIDQLFRLMVDRIELTVPGPHSCEVYTYRNAPPPVYQDKNGLKIDLSREGDAQALSHYVTFLRISAVLYALQKHGDLLLTGTSTFVPYDQNSALIAPDDETNATKDKKGALEDHKATKDDQSDASNDHSGATAQPKSVTPTAGDFINAQNKGAVWEKQGNKWLLGEKVPNAIFYLNHYEPSPQTNIPTPQIDTIEKEIEKDPDLIDPNMNQEATKSLELLIDKQILRNLQYGFSISGPSHSQQQEGVGPCPPPGTESATAESPSPSSRLVLRSLLGVMAAAAQEEAMFRVLNQDTVVPIDRDNKLDAGLQIELPFRQAVPPVERLPLLKLTGDREGLGPPLIEISYAGGRYFVADPKIAPHEAPENQYWNRDVFRLVSELSSQVTVDISKFPLPTILQLNTQ